MMRDTTVTFWLQAGAVFWGLCFLWWLFIGIANLNRELTPDEIAARDRDPATPCNVFGRVSDTCDLTDDEREQFEAIRQREDA